MATLDSNTARKPRAKKTETAPAEEVTLAVVAHAMREGKAQMDEGKAAYDKARKSFLDLMGDDTKLEDDGYTFTVAVPTITTFNAEQMVTDHPEAEFLVTKTVTTTYALDEDAAQAAIEKDDEGVVLALIQEYVSETEGSPRVTIKAVKTNE